MSTPETPTPAPAPGPSRFKSFAAKLAAAWAWTRSPEGRKDIGAALALATAIYQGLHRAGV